MSDIRRSEIHQAVEAGGQAVVALEHVGAGMTMLIERAVTTTTSADPTELRFYDGGVDDVNLLDGTTRGNMDIGEFLVPLLVGSRLVAQWTGMTPGARATLRVQYVISDQGGISGVERYLAGIAAGR